MKNELIMDQKPTLVKSAGVKFIVNCDGKSQGSVVVTGTKIKWYPKGQSKHGFEFSWTDFANNIVNNGKKF